MNVRTKKSFRIPIVIHIYASLILISLLTVAIVYISNGVVLNDYIDYECDNRISHAVISCQNFADAFSRSVNGEDFISGEDIKNYLLESIASATDFSNEASIALFQERDGAILLIWPNQDNQAEEFENSQGLISDIYDSATTIIPNKTIKITHNDSIYYYRILPVGYGESEFTFPSNYEHFYMLVYVDSSVYYSFADAFNFGLFKSIMLSILAAAFISLLASFPLFYSSHKLSKFARRISHGDFSPIKGHIVSQELSDLGDTMNIMAAKLQQTDIEQKTFFQNASHELRTPLMSIQGYAEGIKYGVFDDKEDAVDIIISETNRLSTLVENLLSISKMDMSRSGNYEVKKQKLDVREILETIIGKVRGGFLHQNKELINDINIDEQFIYANENDIFRMFENIFSNCLRYAKQAVKLTVKSRDNLIEFVIEDDGPGISPEVMDHLFERFAKGSEGKHGIGLSLAKAIAEEHNGNIEVSNKDEGGARFKITLPSVKALNQLTNINNNKKY